MSSLQSLIHFYVPLKLGHIGLVAASGLLFAVRGAAAIHGRTWPRLRAWRLLSQFIDTLLLVAGATLWTLIGLNPLHDRWLATKLVLLVVYIVLGALAMREGRAQSTRIGCYVAALAVFLFIVSVALAHHPMGVFAPR